MLSSALHPPPTPRAMPEELGQPPGHSFLKEDLTIIEGRCILYVGKYLRRMHFGPNMVPIFILGAKDSQNIGSPFYTIKTCHPYSVDLFEKGSRLLMLLETPVGSMDKMLEPVEGRELALAMIV